MKIASYDHLDLSAARIMALGFVVSGAAGGALEFALGGALGGATGPTVLMIAALVFYIVATTPRRRLDRERVSQARESLLLSVGSTACLKGTGSRSKTLIMLRPRDQSLASAGARGARMVLLGTPVETAALEASRELASYSAAGALRGVASLKPADFGAGDEETRGLASSSELYRETKLPMLMTVCFFSPILLVLYAIFSHSYDPARLIELVALEFVLVDLALFFSSVDRGPR